MGGDQAPQPVGESTAAMLQAYIQNMPGLVKATGEQITPYGQYQLASQRELAPQYAQLQSDLYNTYGTELNRIGADILQQNALAQAQSDLAVSQGPGKELAQQQLELARITDPEFYAAREKAGTQVGNLLDSINLSGLSGSERAEMERALAREQSSRGLAQAPSNIATLEAANQFGSALQQKRSALGDALNVASQFMTGARSGVDSFQVATGRQSMPNPGNAQFQGVNQNAGQDVMSMGQGFMSEIGQNQRTAMDINSQRRDSLDRVTGVLGSLPNVS